MLKNLLIFLSSNSLSILWAVLSIFSPYFSEPLDVVVIMDVGQGDAILVQKAYYQMIIDGGPDISALYSLPKYMPKDDMEIEVVVLTHPHDDHIKGILEIAKRYAVKELWLYPVCFENSNYKNLLESGINIKYVNAGMSYIYEDIKLDILWPKKGQYVDCFKPYDGNINNDSVVIQLDYLNKKFLLMGDAETPVEREILKVYTSSLDIDILKVGHHCSKSSTSETFLIASTPSIAVCSCSKENKFGHPDRGTIQRLLFEKVQIFNTYESGDVVFR